MGSRVTIRVVRAVIFDFGGVLACMGDPYGRRKWERFLGLEEGTLFKAVLDTEVSLRATLGQVSEEDMWRQIGANFGLDAEQLAEFRHDFWLGEQINHELVTFLRELRPRFKTAILTNAWSGAREELSGFGLDKEVDLTVVSAEEGVAKPDPRIYQIAAERLSVQAGEAVFLDDLVENVRGAQTAGMQAVHFGNSAQAIAEIRGYLNHR